LPVNSALASHEFFAMYVSELVRNEVAARFSSNEVPRVVAQLEQTALPFLSVPGPSRERDRVHLAILKCAEGSYRRFEASLALAAQDWRDVLMSAGLGEENWPEVLRATGYPVP
jgi:hypothetical protein